MTVLLYVRRKRWPLESVSVECDHRRVARPAPESAGGEVSPYADIIRQRVVLKGDLTPEQRDRIAYIAGRCPVNRTLQNNPIIEEEVVLAD